MVRFRVRVVRVRVRVRVRVTEVRKWTTPAFLQGPSKVNMQFRLTNSQRYLVNVKPGTNHSTNPTNPNGKSKR